MLLLDRGGVRRLAPAAWLLAAEAIGAYERFRCLEPERPEIPSPSNPSSQARSRVYALERRLRGDAPFDFSVDREAWRSGQAPGEQIFRGEPIAVTIRLYPR